jgi:hypothetical protein
VQWQLRLEARVGIGQAPLRVAALHGHEEVAELLRQHDGLGEPVVKAAGFESDEMPLPESRNRI